MVKFFLNIYPKMSKTRRKNEKAKSLKKMGLVTTIQPELDFSRTCGFREVLDNV